MEGSICLQLKPNGSEVLPMHGIEESKGDGVKQSVPDLNDEPLGCSLKEVEFEKKEEIEECRKDGHVDNVKVDELNEDDGKKKRPVEDNVDGKEYNVKKRVKEEGLECKLQFSGRVLRSRSAVKTGSVIEADKVEHRVVKTEDENNSEMKTIEVFTEGNDQSHGEVKGFEKETLELQVGENDCPDGEVRKKIKCKLGRPPKVLDNDRYVKKGFTTAPESDHIDGDVSKESKGKCGRPRKVARKRGRPRKKQDNSGFEKKEFTVEAEESDQSVGGGIKKSNHNLPHVGQVNGQKTRGIEEEADVVKAGESYHSDVEVRKEANHKQESQLKMNVYDGVEMKAAGEGMGEGDHFDCESRKKVMRQRGRPPKFQRKNVFEKKTLKPQVGQNDCPDGEVKKCKRGRPPKVLGNGRYVKKGFTTEARESDRFDGDVSKELKGKRGRPRKVGKRGRPRKVQENSGFENKEIKADAEGGDQSNGGGIKKSNLNLGHGSPVKGQRTRGVEEEADVVKAVESCDSDVEAREVANHKHESPPKMNVDNEVEMKAVDAEMGEGDHFDCESRKKVMHQCGRPPKVQDSDVLLNKQEGIDQCNSKVKEGLLRKSGRPAKLQGGSKGLKGRVINGRKKLSGLRRGRKKLRGSLKFNMPVSTSYSEKRLIGKESNLKRSAIKDRFDDMNKNGSKASLMLSPKFLNAKGNKKGVKKAGDEGELRRSEAKQAVRDRIVNLLKAAGWTIDYRPRNKREYNDAVYVNPEGKTHWSVTLAYRVLKKYYENGDPKSCPNGFVFTPIPEEELSILKRIVQKKRVGKKKPEGDDDDTEDDGQVKKKMNKRKRKWKSNEKKERGTQMCKLQQKQKRKQCALLVRNSMDGAGCDNDGYVLYDGKRTLLSWMIDSGTVPQGGKVEYLIQKRTRTRESKSGSITRDGIRCNCCSDVFSIEEFEIHVGCKFQRPFWNICLDTGVPLLQCLLDAWNKQQQSEIKGIHFVDFGEDPNDDSCGICGDGGDLICCDSCPSAFHQGCLGIEEFPSDNWNCVYCTCKYCGVVGNMSQSDKDNDADPTVLTCQLCEEKYHEPCIQPMDAFDDDSSSAFFCTKRCKELSYVCWYEMVAVLALSNLRGGCLHFLSSGLNSLSTRDVSVIELDHEIGPILCILFSKN